VTWFRVDDGFAFHHKAVGAGNAALGLWVRAGSWCSQQGNDGVVPAHMVKALGGTRKDALALCAFGLWDDLEDGRFAFHDWLNYQPSAAEVRADRLAKSEKKAEAGRLGGIASGVSRRANAKQPRSTDEANEEADDKQNEAPSLPLPTQTPSVSTRDLAFEEFWLVYPRKIGKGQARKAWERAIKTADVADVMAGVVRFARTPGREERFTPHPATWLNGERWLDVASERARDPQYAWDV
jgi:hypothetical protein